MTSEHHDQRRGEEVSASSTDRPSRSRLKEIPRGEEERREEEVSCSHLIGDRHHFSVADPIGASTTHDGEYSFGFLSWLARDLGASIDYAKSRLKSGFWPRGSSMFCLVKPEICTSSQIAIDYRKKIGRVILYLKNQMHSHLLTVRFEKKTSFTGDCYKKSNLQLTPCIFEADERISNFSTCLVFL